MGKALGGLQDQVELRLMGRLPRRRGYGKWEHTLEEVAIEEGGLETMETYINRRQNTVTHCIDIR